MAQTQNSGIAPNAGFQMPDGKWLRGLANGVNLSFQAGFIAHAGGTKALAFQLPANRMLLEVDTVASDHDSCLLPTAVPGTLVAVYNAGAHILDLYGRGTNTINAAATANAFSLNANQTVIVFCAKTGLWAANKTA